MNSNYKNKILLVQNIYLSHDLKQYITILLFNYCVQFLLNKHSIVFAIKFFPSN